MIRSGSDAEVASGAAREGAAGIGRVIDCEPSALSDFPGYDAFGVQKVRQQELP